MKDPKTSTVILLTGTIHPNSNDILSVKDPQERKKQYLEAISFYLKNTSYKIIFTENSGTSLKKKFEGNERMEFLTFTSPYTVPDRGKGWKELEIMDYAIKNSKFIKSGGPVLKITGRLKLLNIDKIENQVERLRSESDYFIICNIYKPFKMDSRCFLFTHDFWPVLFKNGQSIDLNFSFERALWKAVCEYDLCNFGRYFQFTGPLRIEGISGGLGVHYKHGLLLTTIKKVRHLFMVPLIYKRFRKVPQDHTKTKV